MKDGDICNWDEIDLCLQCQFGITLNEWIGMLFNEAMLKLTMEIAEKGLKEAGLLK